LASAAAAGVNVARSSRVSN